jgi:hypothetical protein
MSVSAEDGQVHAALRRARQPAGAVFALGWVMAELFDPRRRANVTVGTPPFNRDAQLPLVADLDPDPKFVFLAAELSELLHWFPQLHSPLLAVTAQTDKKKAAVRAQNLATAEAAAQAGEPALAADDVAHAEAAAVAVAEAAFSQTHFRAALAGLHQAILDGFADDPERLSAYQLGLSLSDLVWLPCIAAPGRDTPDSGPGTLLGLFARPHLATVQTLLSGAGAQLPPGAGTMVSRSLENWANWIDVNSGRIKPAGQDTWGPEADVVLHALRVQGWVWRSVLIADPEAAVQLGMGAWIQAGSSIARAAREVGGVIVRRFWPLVVLVLVTLGGLLYLVISSLSGVAEVWASLATVAAVLGSGSWGLGSGVSSSLSGVGYEIWNAAKLDAAAWGITWLPALSGTMSERARLERRGVAMPQLRKSLDMPQSRKTPQFPQRPAPPALASVACRKPRTPTPPSGSRTSASATGSQETTTGPGRTPSAARSWRNCCRSTPGSRSRSWTSGPAPGRPPGPSSITTPPPGPSSPTSRRR